MANPFALPLSDASRSGFRALKGLLLEHRRAVGLGMASLLVTDLCQLLMPQLIGNGVEALFSSGATGAVVIPLVTRIGILAFIIAIFRYLWRHFFFTAARRAERELRARIFERLLTLSPAWYQRTKTGDLMSLLISDLEAVRMALAIGVVTATDAVLYTSFALIAILVIDAKLALLCLLPFPFIILAVLYFDQRIEDSYDAQQNQVARLTEKVREGFAAVRLLKAYAREADETARLDVHNRELVRRSLKLAKQQAVFMPLITTLAGLSLALLIFFGGPAVARGAMGYGDFIKFFFYLGMLAWPMMAVGWTVTLVVRGCVSMHRLQTLLDEKPEIRDPEPDRAEGAAPERDRYSASAQGSSPQAPSPLQADALTFTYPGADRPALDNVSFTLPPGGHLGIVGGVGAGKSTLLALLQRHYDPQAGGVLLGGRDLRALRLEELRARLVPVAQEAMLFSMTLADNIRLGRDGDPAPAARGAALENDLRELPQGLATVVGEKGITLSGGQKQRAALARALFNPPPILLLDDTLSAVDAGTEQQLIDTLRKDWRGHSLVIVSHKISAVAHCDEILVLDAGRVSQRGTHTDLMAQEGEYRQIARLQRLESEL